MQDKIRIDIETGLMIDAVPPYEFGEDIIETPCLIPFYKPKWNGTEWVEGLTQEQIQAIKDSVVVEQSETQMLRDYVLDLDMRIIMMEFGL